MNIIAIVLYLRYQQLVSQLMNKALSPKSQLYRNEIRLRNDLYCVGWGVKLYSLTHSHRNEKLGREAASNKNSFSKSAMSRNCVYRVVERIMFFYDM